MKFLKIVLYICFFIAAVVAFLPKKNLYYFGEEQLAKFKVVIANEQVGEGLFSLDLEHADLYVEGIRAAKVMEASLGIYIVHNALEAHQIRLSGMAKNFLPTRIETLRISYNLWDPLAVRFVAEGEFGVAYGAVLLTKRKIIMTLQPSKTMLGKYRNLLRQMKKAKNGEYSYEQSF